MVLFLITDFLDPNCETYGWAAPVWWLGLLLPVACSTSPATTREPPGGTFRN